jgi:hypothetical protein
MLNSNVIGRSDFSVTTLWFRSIPGHSPNKRQSRYVALNSNRREFAQGMPVRPMPISLILQFEGVGTYVRTTAVDACRADATSNNPAKSPVFRSGHFRRAN